MAKFITIKNKYENYKINIEKVEIINIFSDNIEFIFNDNKFCAMKKYCINFDEVKEIVKNL